MQEVYSIEVIYHDRKPRDYIIVQRICADRDITFKVAHEMIKGYEKSKIPNDVFDVVIRRHYVIETSEHASMKDTQQSKLIGKYGVFGTDPMPQWRFYE